MKIVGFKSENDVSSRVRVFWWLDALKQRGHDVTYYPEFDLSTGQIDDKVKGADIVVSGRCNTPQDFAALLAGRHLYGYRLVIDTDDLVSGVSSDHASFTRFHSGTGASRMADAQYRMADAVTTTTEYLADACREHNKYVYVVPNCVNGKFWATGKFREKEFRHRTDLRVLHAGASNHYRDLDVVKEPIKQLLAEYQQMKMVFCGFVPDWAASYPMDRVFMLPFVGWDRWPKVIRWVCADVGIAPLKSNPLNLAKSNIKYLDFAMAHIPAVYQDIDTYANVQHGITGMKASTSADWYQSVKTLLDDRALRRSISKAASADAERNWNIEDRVSLYENIMQETLKRPIFKIETPIEVPAAQELTEGEVIECQTSS